MKLKQIIGLLAVCVTSNVLAQNANSTKSPVDAGDVVEVVSVDQMPIPLPPGEAEKMRKNGPISPTDGFSTVEKVPGSVKGFVDHVNAVKNHLQHQGNTNENGQRTVPEVHKDMSTLKLAFKPANFNHGGLIAATPSGTKVKDAWTGVDRFFQIDGAGSVRLSEVDMAASGGKFFMMKEAINTRVRGKPAISKIFTDEDGQTIEEVVWVEGNKFFMLTFRPDLIAGTKTKASYLTAHSLAQELQ
ncbi:hypothetical protein EGT07_08065 [Herbaspirillum sp. HC18]|nr:hypothetical protein EGT07_08065 [Herbaspirillum sp. HC18]